MTTKRTQNAGWRRQLLGAKLFIMTARILLAHVFFLPQKIRLYWNYNCTELRLIPLSRSIDSLLLKSSVIKLRTHLFRNKRSKEAIQNTHQATCQVTVDSCNKLLGVIPHKLKGILKVIKTKQQNISLCETYALKQQRYSVILVELKTCSTWLLQHIVQVCPITSYRA